MHTFHYRVLSENFNLMKILKVDAKWLELKSKTMSQSGLLITDFPGFNDEKLSIRKPMLWLHSGMTGYCCGHEDEFFIKVQ